MTAWRVTRDPAVRLVMDIGPASERRATSHSRVLSPRAAKRSADAPASLLPRESGRLGKVFLDEAGLDLPAALVRLKRLGAASQRNLVKSRFGNFQQNSDGGVE